MSGTLCWVSWVLQWNIKPECGLGDPNPPLNPLVFHTTGSHWIEEHVLCALYFGGPCISHIHKQTHTHALKNAWLPWHLESKIQCWPSTTCNSKDPLSWLSPFRPQGKPSAHFLPWVLENCIKHHEDCVLSTPTASDTLLQGTGRIWAGEVLG